MHRTRVFVSVSALLLPFLLGTTSLCAASPSVTAVLSNSDVAVGETVQLEIRVTDANNAVVPSSIAVDGLQIQQTGTSRQFEMRNFKTTSSTTYSYTVLPMKAGTFKIPSQIIRVGNDSARTPELTLRVSGSPRGGGSAAGGGGSSNVDPNKLAFTELIVPKKTGYVGEMIPVVVRLASAAPFAEPPEPPEVVGQGFTVQKLQGGEQPEIEMINGRRWLVYTLKTAIAATRAGKLEIGPVKARASLIVPSSRSRNLRRRSPFDLFNMDDPFSDPFFADPFGRFGGEKRIVEISGEPVSLEVKSLPPNAPPSFTGAVGNFTMTMDAKPKTVQIGDPITVTATISGRGNFDRVNAPVLQDEQGWHKYPPTAKFKQDDDVGISGEKTFESVLSPNDKKDAVPPLLFSYFDPAKEKYVTLQSEAVPIRVEGNAAAAATAASASPAGSQPNAPVPRGTPKPADILYQLNERRSQSESFTPLFARREFWMAQLVPLLGLIAFAAWKVRQNRRYNREVQRVATLEHEMTELMRQLRRKDAHSEEYFPKASRVVQIKAALASHIDPNAVDIETAAKTFDLDTSEREQLRQLFQRSDELRYSGVQNGGETVSPDRRREVLHLLENLRA